MTLTTAFRNKVDELQSEIDALLSARVEMTQSDDALRANNHKLERQLDAQLVKNEGLAARIEQLEQVIDGVNEAGLAARIEQLEQVIDGLNETCLHQG